MWKPKSFQRRIFIYFFSAFLLFTIVVLSFQYIREINFKKSQIERTLSDVSSMMSKYISQHDAINSNKLAQLDSLMQILPYPDLRLTVINSNGTVVFDNFVSDSNTMENHLSRIEIQLAAKNGSGSNIRHSETTNQQFYYHATLFDGYFVRCAMLYNPSLHQFLKISHTFILFCVLLLVAMCIILHLLTTQLGDFTEQLRHFAVKAGKGEAIILNETFKDTEFGDIQHQIMSIYNELKESKDALSAEKERLFNHLYALNEGIAFFTIEKKKVLANAHFIQFSNMISQRSNISIQSFFEIESLEPLVKKIDKVLKSKKTINPRKLPHFEMKIGGENEIYFRIQTIIFQDRSFEILIEDITRLEKRRLLKQQLTSNIAHELKTPLASIKGYLETLLNNQQSIPMEKQHYFLERAFNQTERLNLLLNDISLINNMEDAAELFEMKQVKMKTLINDVVENLSSRLLQHQITVNVEVASNLEIYGNDSLITSIFQNFLENTIKYAGDGVNATIKQYTEDEKFYYFSFSNNGKTIPEEHLPRIFERFYRIEHGRTRDSGGTGLGLSIVKNAVQLHKGEISVRNRPDGGIVFLFSLAKEKN